MSSEHSNPTDSNPEHQNQDESPQQQNQPSTNGIGLIQTIISVFAAMFGVQSESKHQRDFEQGSASNFIAAGIIFVILLIITIFYLVNTVLENAGMN